MPAVVAIHGALGDAREGADGVFGAEIERVRPVVPDGLHLDVAHPEVGEVEAGPHLVADGVTHLPGILARGGDAVADRVGVGGLEGQVVGQGVGVGQHEVFVVGRRI